MSSRVERSSQRIESRLSATPSPEPSAHAAASEGAFSPLGAAAAGQINAAAPMQPPPPVDPHIVALVRDLKAAVVKLALKESRLNELERRPALHVVLPKRTRAASLAAQPTEEPQAALIQPRSAATRRVRAKFGRRRDLAAFLRQRAKRAPAKEQKCEQSLSWLHANAHRLAHLIAARTTHCLLPDGDYSDKQLDRVHLQALVLHRYFINLKNALEVHGKGGRGLSSMTCRGQGSIIPAVTHADAESAGRANADAPERFACMRVVPPDRVPPEVWTGRSLRPHLCARRPCSDGGT